MKQETPKQEAIYGTTRRVWDPFEKVPYQVLAGTRTAFDGTVLATSHDGRAFPDQVAESLAILNVERRRLGLVPVELKKGLLA